MMINIITFLWNPIGKALVIEIIISVNDENDGRPLKVMHSSIHGIVISYSNLFSGGEL